jgi:hypothetical protein
LRGLRSSLVTHRYLAARHAESTAHEKERMTQRHDYRGLLLLAATGLVLLLSFAWGYLGRPDPPRLVAKQAFGGLLEIQSADPQMVEVQRVVVNDREGVKDCDILREKSEQDCKDEGHFIPPPGADPEPFLGCGYRWPLLKKPGDIDDVFYSARCGELASAEIVTDRGTVAYQVP